MVKVVEFKPHLQIDEEDQRYITDDQLEDNEHLASLLKQTINSWYRDDSKQRYYLYPSIQIPE